MAPNQQDEEHQRLDDLPREMLFCIMNYCDPRSLVNVICTSKNLRTITVQIILMGFKYQEIVREGIRAASWYSRNSEDKKEIYPANLLMSIIDLLMKEQEVEMDRINLLNFTSLRSSELGRIAKFILKFKIPELIVSPQYYHWIKDNINSSLKSITRLSFGKELDAVDGNYFQTLVQRPFTVCNGLCVKNAMDVKNIIGNTDLCSGLKVLTLCVYTSVLAYSFKEILKSCPLLQEFNLFINGFSNDIANTFSRSREYDFEITDDLMEVLTNSNLEILRFDTSFAFENFNVINQLTENKRRSILPKLKIFSNHTVNQDIDLLLLPNHPLESVSLNLPLSVYQVNVPKCQNFYLTSQDAPILPIVDAFKYTISDASISLTTFYENLTACTLLKELYLFNVEAGFQEYTFKNIKTSIELLYIKKSRLPVYLVNHMIDNSPDLKSLTMENVKVREYVNSDLVLEFEDQDVDSQLRYIHINTCSEMYPKVFKNILKKNLPNLHSMILENTYSIDHNSLHTLFNKASSLSVFKVTGAEFTDELIDNFFKSFSPVSLEYGIDFSFNGQKITSPFLLQQPFMRKVTNLSLPDCKIPNDDFVQLLDLLNPDLIRKIQVTLIDGPTIEILKKLKHFKNLEMIYISGRNPEPVKNLESFILKEFAPSMPSLILLFLESGEFIKEEIELTKSNIRSSGKSAPKLILPLSKKNVIYSIEKEDSTSSCSLQ